MKPPKFTFSFAVAFILLAVPVKAEEIKGAHYASAVDRYGHFALGRPHEYARLIVTTDTGRSAWLDLSDEEVFEDITPRLVTLGAGQPREVLAVVSHRNSGARLAIFRLRDGRLEASANSAPIGTPYRWLNPVGVADLDGDGLIEIAVVTTPHIGGTLKIYRRSGSKLIETAALPNFSNHIFGKSEHDLSTVVSINGEVRMLVPDSGRTWLRVIALRSDGLKEVARCGLPAQVTGPVKAVSPSTVSIGTVSGQQMISFDECLH